jgi:hypothetical protein
MTQFTVGVNNSEEEFCHDVMIAITPENRKAIPLECFIIFANVPSFRRQHCHDYAPPSTSKTVVVSDDPSHASLFVVVWDGNMDW